MRWVGDSHFSFFVVISEVSTTVTERAKFQLLGECRTKSACCVAEWLDRLHYEKNNGSGGNT